MQCFKIGINNLGVEMLGNMKIKVTAKDGQKIINILWFNAEGMLFNEWRNTDANGHAESVLSMANNMGGF